MYVCVYMVGIQVCISSECVDGTTIERKRERVERVFVGV